MQKKAVAFLIIATLFSLSYLADSDNVTYPRDQIERDLALIQKASYYNFDISVFPGDAEVKAGENVTVNVTVVNTGRNSLHQFNLSLEGVDYPYQITPNADEIPLWGDWNPKDGMMRGKQTYQLTISVPSNTTGVSLLNVTGRENFSWRKFSNKGIFILKVIPSVPVEPNIKVSKINVPLNIKENVPFNISFSVDNMNLFRQQLDFAVDIPSDWVAVEGKKSLLIDANNSSNVTFTIIPTNTSGNISVNIVYPFKKNIFSVSREGPSLTPVTEAPKEEAVKKQTGLAGVLEFIRNLSPIFLAILVLIVVIVAWFIVKLVQFYSSRRKPESMSRQAEISSYML